MSATSIDIAISKGVSRLDSAPLTAVVAAAATTINMGEPVFQTGGTQTVTQAVTAAPVTTTPNFLGIAMSKSTQTATVAGLVDVAPLTPGVVFVGYPTTAANFATQALYNAQIGKRVTWTLTGSTFTINNTDAATNGLEIMYLDLSQPGNAGQVAFMVREQCNVAF